MKKKNIITEIELNCRDNEYVDHIEGEVWKSMEEYPNYIISNMGRVFTKNRNKVLKPFLCPIKSRENKVLYFIVKLTNKFGAVKNMFVHRVVALAFVENAENKPIIHHIDHNELNNRADNLMWVTADEHRELHRKEAEKNKGKDVSK